MMTLENLLAIKRLQSHEPQRAAFLKLLEAAVRNLNDAHLLQLSAENRFDAAYKCIMQCAMLGLWACGYRVVTSQPGHHHTALQSLGLTMAIPQERIVVLDALRKQRNVSDYEGDPISEALLESCMTEARHLLSYTRRWLHERLPDSAQEQ